MAVAARSQAVGAATLAACSSSSFEPPTPPDPLEVAAIGQHPHVLLGVQGVAAGPGQQRGLQLRGEQHLAEQLPDQAGDVCLGQRRQRHDRRVRLAASPAWPARQQLRPGGGHQQQGDSRSATARRAWRPPARRVALQDAGLGLDDLPQRPQRHPLPVGQAAALPPGHQLRVGLNGLQQLPDHPALADPRDPDQGHQLGRLLAAGPIQRPRSRSTSRRRPTNAVRGAWATSTPGWPVPAAPATPAPARPSPWPGPGRPAGSRSPGRWLGRWSRPPGSHQPGRQPAVARRC